MSVTIWIILTLLGAILIWRLTRRNRWREMIDEIPGPPAWPIIGNLFTFIHIKSAEDFYNFLLEHAKKYPYIYRVWWLRVPMVKIAHPKYIELLLSNSQNIKKSQDYEFISKWLGTGLLTSTGAKWHSRRKLLTPAFHFSILEQFVPVFCDKSRILVEKLRFAAKNSPEGVDIVPYITRCALDIICETAMGTPINAQEDTDSEYMTTLHEVNGLLLHRMISPLLYNDFLFYLSPSGRRQRKCVKILHDFTNKVIRERKEELKYEHQTVEVEADNKDEITAAFFGVKKKIAFLDLLIGMQKKENFSDEDIREEVDTFMFETECVKELQEIFGDSNRDPGTGDLNAMKYLERVIKESLRIRPAVYAIARKTEKALVCDKFTIPPGVELSVDILNLHRNPEIYPDPEKFDPDRFLPENCLKRHPYAYIPFSAGPRNCIGQKFAILEMKTELSLILRNFELRCINPERDLQPIPDLILRPVHGITLQIVSRR